MDDQEQWWWDDPLGDEVFQRQDMAEQTRISKEFQDAGGVAGWINRRNKEGEKLLAEYLSSNLYST